MAVNDFRANRVRLTTLIGSCSGGTQHGGPGSYYPGVTIYSSSVASSFAGAVSDSAMLDGVGQDVFLFVSGSKNNGREGGTGAGTWGGGVSLFGGDVVVSGTFYAETIIAEVDETTTGSMTVSGSLFVSKSVEISGSSWKAGHPAATDASDSLNQYSLSFPAASTGVAGTIVWDNWDAAVWEWADVLYLYGARDVVLTSSYGKYIWCSYDALEVNVNPDRLLMDFRVESPNSGYLLWCDASSDSVIIQGPVNDDTTVFTVKGAGDAVDSIDNLFNVDPALGTLVNYDQNDHDFLAKGQNASELFRVDASLDRVEIEGAIGDNTSLFIVKGNDDAGTGVADLFTVDPDGVTVNDGGGLVDFKVESADSVNMLSVDGTNDRVYVQGPIGDDTVVFQVYGNDDAGTGNSASLFEVWPTAVVLNQAGGNVNFRVESQTKDYMLFVDAANDKIGINKSSPDRKLHIYDDGAVGTIEYPLRLEKASQDASDPIKGFGVGIEFELEDAVAAPVVAGTIAGRWFNATSQFGEVVLSAHDGSNLRNTIIAGHDRALILSGGAAASVDYSSKADVALYVSGTRGSRGTSVRGAAVFGGDLHISGAVTSDDTEFGAWTAAVSGFTTLQNISDYVGVGYATPESRLMVGSGAPGEASTTVFINSHPNFSASLGFIKGSGATATNKVALSYLDDESFTLVHSGNFEEFTIRGSSTGSDVIGNLMTQGGVSLMRMRPGNNDFAAYEAPASPDPYLPLWGSQLLFLSGGGPTDPDPATWTDTNFYVSGSIGSAKGDAGAWPAATNRGRGTATFGGDMVVSGAVHIGDSFASNGGDVAVWGAALKISLNSTTGNRDGVRIDAANDGVTGVALNVSGKRGLKVYQDISSGYGLYVLRNLNETGASPLGYFYDLHSATTQPTVKIRQDGIAANALEVNHEGTATMVISSSGTTAIGGDVIGNANIWLDAGGGAIFNQQSNAVDFRVESDSMARMLFVDGTNNKVSVAGHGANPPASDFEVGNGVGSRTVTINAGSGAASGSLAFRKNNDETLGALVLGQGSNPDFIMVNSGSGASLIFKTEDAGDTHTRFEIKPEAFGTQVLFLSGGAAGASNPINWSDTNFFVSGSTGNKNHASIRGTAVFGGDMVVSGTIYDGSGEEVGGGGWEDDGTNVRLKTSTDQVGIGTASPATKLEIEVGDSEDLGGLFIDFNETGAHVALEIDSEAGGYGLKVTAASAAYIESDDTAGEGLKVYRNVVADTNPLAFIHDDAAATAVTLKVQQDGTGNIVTFHDGGTEVFTVADGGHVGIVQPDPVVNLVVGNGAGARSIHIDAGAASSGSLAFSKGGNDPGATISFDSSENLVLSTVNTAGLNKDIIFKVNDNGVDTEVMRVDGSAASVAIGTNSNTTNKLLVVAGASEGLDGIKIDQDDSDERALWIDSEGQAAYITCKEGIEVNVNVDGGYGFKTYRNQDAGDTSDPLVFIRDQDGDQIALKVQQESTDSSAFAITAGNGGGVKTTLSGSGQVGIGKGTNSYSAMLHVKGIERGDGIVLEDADSSDTVVKIYESTDDGVVDVYANNSVTARIHGNGDSYLGGPLGIGTTSPGSPLTIETSSTIDVVKVRNTNDNSSGAIITVENNRGGSGDGEADDFCGALRFHAQDNAGTTTEYGRISGKVQSPSNGSESGKIIFETTTPLANKGTPLHLRGDRVLILSGGAGASTDESAGVDVSFYVSGSLSSAGTSTRGTSVFGGDLVVSGSVQVADYIRHAGDGDTYLRFETDAVKITVADSAVISYNDSEGSIVLNADEAARNTIIKTAAGTLAFAVKNSTEQVLILSGGSAASTNYADKVDVNFFVSGSTGSKGTSTRGTSVFAGDVVISGSAYDGSGNLIGAAGWSDDGAVVRTSTATDYVGMGTSAPEGILHVKGSGATTLFVESTTSSGSLAFLNNSGNISAGLTYDDSDDALVLFNSGSGDDIILKYKQGATFKEFKIDASANDLILDTGLEIYFKDLDGASIASSNANGQNIKIDAPDTSSASMELTSAGALKIQGRNPASTTSGAVNIIAGDKTQIKATDNTGTIRTGHLVVQGGSAVQEVVINEDSQDYIDFRVETDGSDKAIYVDADGGLAGTGEVHIGGSGGAGWNGDFNVHSTSRSRTLFVDGQASKVGILLQDGTTSRPQAELQIGAGLDNLDMTVWINVDSDASGSFAIAQEGDTVAAFVVDNDDTVNIVHSGSNSSLNLKTTSTSYIVLNSEGTSAPGADVNLLVSGAISSKDGSTRGTALFLGDVHVSGSLTSDNTSFGQWTDGGSFLYPSDNSGAETIVIGGTSTAGGDIILGAAGGAVFNEQGNSADFRVESNNKEYAVLVDGSTDQVLILSGGDASSYDEAAAADVNFYASGSVGSRGSSTRGTAVFGGDLHISGTVTSDNTNFGQWTDGGTFIYPADNDGAETIIIGASNTNDANILLGADGAAVFNKQGAAVDFRARTQTNGHALFISGGDNAVMLGTQNTAGLDAFLSVSGSILSRGVSANRGVSVFGGDLYSSGAFFLKKLATNPVVGDIGSNNVGLYAKDDGGTTKLFYMDDAGTEIMVAGGGSGGAADANAEFLVLAATGSLTSERVFVAGDGLSSTDAGAGNSFTVEMDYAGADSFILAATDGTGITVDGDNDKLVLYDNDAAVVKFVNAGQVGTTYTAGDGLDLSGAEFSTDLKTAGGLVIDATELAIDNSVVATLTGSQFSGNVGITGSFGVTDGALFKGNVTLGNTTSDDITFTGYAASHIIPKTDSSYDLGSTTKRWANVYTGDLHLRNDQGNWTIKEDADKLIVINNLTGKKYKMMLEPLEENE